MKLTIELNDKHVELILTTFALVLDKALSETLLTDEDRIRYILQSYIKDCVFAYERIEVKRAGIQQAKSDVEAVRPKDDLFTETQL